jgi:outer membrane protein
LRALAECSDLKRRGTFTAARAQHIDSTLPNVLRNTIWQASRAVLLKNISKYQSMIHFSKMVFLLLLYTAGIAKAQVVLTLEDVLHYALQNSEVLKQARLDIENVQYQINETRASALPQVNIVSSLTGNPIVQQFVLPAEAFGGPPGEFIAIKAGQTWNAMSQVQFNQQIFNQQVFAGLKAAKGGTEYYKLMEQLSEENVIQQVATNFYQVIITRQQMNVVAANFERVKKLETMVAGQYENGLAKKIDLDRIRVNRANLEAQQLQLDIAVAQQENLLKYYMGMPIGQPITIRSEELTKLENTLATSVPEDGLNTEQLLSFKILRKQEELSILQQKTFRAEYYPTLSLGANYTYNTQSSEFNLYTAKSLRYDMAAVSLTLRIPLFEGNARAARIKQSDVSLLKIKEDLNKTTNSLNMAYENARNQVRNSLKAIHTQQANRQLAEEVFFSTQNNYKNGLATLTDLLNAESEQVAAQNSYNEALLNYKVAELELIKSNGNIRSLVHN